MRRRTFEEMITYFNQTVSEMDIDRKYKMTLLGMVTALLQRHDEDVAQIVRCKDCKRHNGAFGDFLINEQRYLREDEVCPLVYWRGKAKGHEFDYQYCIYGERRTNETD